MTTKHQLSQWFDRGLEQESTYMIIVCDTYDHEDYPVFATTDEDVVRKYASHNGPNMQRVMEVYDLRDNKEEQLDKTRVMRLPAIYKGNA